MAIERLLCEQPAAGRPPMAAMGIGGSVTMASDAQLAGAICAGELPALEEAFRRHAIEVATSVRRIAGEYFVDDVVQEVFVTLWRAPERFRPQKGTLASFLCMVARTKTIDAIRSNHAWQRRHLKHGERRRQGAGPEDEAIANVSAAAIRTALQGLAPTERVAIELAFFGGYSYREVATQLGEPEGTIKSRIRSGLHHLRTQTPLRGLSADTDETAVFGTLAPSESAAGTSTNSVARRSICALGEGPPVASSSQKVTT